MKSAWQTEVWRLQLLTMGPQKERALKLNLETRNLSDVIIVYCQGRIVYRDEAAALSGVVEELLRPNSKLVLDLSGVSAIDSAGIGELALLHTLGVEKNASLKYAGATSQVRGLLNLTNLDRVLEMHPSVEDAVDSFSEAQVCDC